MLALIAISLLAQAQPIATPAPDGPAETGKQVQHVTIIIPAAPDNPLQGTSGLRAGGMVLAVVACGRRKARRAS